jgi:hypothetical protein
VGKVCENMPQKDDGTNITHVDGTRLTITVDDCRS